MDQRPPHEYWVFAYGSLMWRPGFAYEERSRARLVGYQRCFCIYSRHHRGTVKRPGLVLGLDRGGVCEGIAYRVAAERWDATLGYLRAREQVTYAYRERHVMVHLPSLPAEQPRDVYALAYLAEPAHPAYAGHLHVTTQARLIAGARGISGLNLDYFISTLAHLKELGIRERTLERVMTLIGPLAAAGCGCGEDAPQSRARSAALCASWSRKAVAHPLPPSNYRTRFAYRAQR